MKSGSQQLSKWAFVLMLALASTPAPASPLPLVVRLSSPESVRAQPGELITVALNIESTDQSSQHVTTTLELPDGWRVAVPMAPLTLDAGQQVVRLISIRVPESASVGTHPINVFVRIGDSEEVVQVSIRVNVAPRYNTVLRVTDYPRAVADGGPFLLTALVSNRGNAPDRFRLNVNVDSPFAGRLSDSTVELAPGEEHEIQVTVTRVGAPPTQRQTVTVNVMAISELDAGRRARSVVTVEVTPVNSARGGGNDVPAQIRLAAAGRGGEPASQVEVSSSRYGNWPISFDIRLPQIGGSQYRSPDHYSASYRTQRFTAVIGDGYYALTPLIGSQNQSFGAATEFNHQLFRLSAYGARSRFSTTEAAQGALQLRFGTDAASMGLSYLSSEGEYEGDVVSLRGSLVPMRATHIDAEVSRGTASAERLRAGGRHDWGSYSVEWSRADVDFPGILRGQEQRHVRVALRPQSWLHLEGRYSDIKRDLTERPFTRLIHDLNEGHAELDRRNRSLPTWR
ncbi:hypothetical protein BH23BAC4_BH23BAC4_08220 [soil metagenome]